MSHLARKLMMSQGGDGINWTDVFNGFELTSTFTGGPTNVKDYLDALVAVPFGTRAIEGGRLSWDEADGAYLGPELNASLDSQTGWAVIAGVTISGGSAATTGATYNWLYGNPVRQAYQYGHWRVVLTVSAVTGAGIRVAWPGKTEAFITTPGTYTYDYTATATGGVYLQSSVAATITSYSLKELIPVWLPTNLTPQHTIMGKAKYGAGFKGYLNEPSRANLVYPSRDFTGARWTSTNVTTVKDQTGPDGVANSACSVTATANNGTLASTATVSASSAKVGSFFIKRITGTGTVEISVDSGTSYTDVTALINSTTYTQVTAAATSTNPQLIIRLGTSGDAIAADYAQVEVGAFVTSPITTTTAAVTRPVSNLTRPKSGVLPVNNWGTDFEVIPLAAGQANWMFGSYLNASNFVNIGTPAANGLQYYKRIANVNYVLSSIIYAHVKGVRIRIQAYQSSVYGMGFRCKAGAGAWSAWTEKNDADGRRDIVGGSAYYIGSRDGTTTHFAGNYPFLAILTDPDPKAKLILAATLYPTS